MPSELIGYASKFSVSPGEGIRFMVSTDERQYEVNMVRLIHGDENPAGPGFKENLVQTSVNRNYAGSKQVVCTGSYLLLSDPPLSR